MCVCVFFFSGIKIQYKTRWNYSWIKEEGTTWMQSILCKVELNKRSWSCTNLYTVIYSIYIVLSTDIGIRNDSELHFLVSGSFHLFSFNLIPVTFQIKITLQSKNTWFNQNRFNSGIFEPSLTSKSSEFFAWPRNFQIFPILAWSRIFF